jgi:predicted AAA+ superfamily ATPase
MVWNAIPSQLSRENRKFVYGAVKPGARAREYENAISWLAGAGLVTKLHRISKPGLPLNAYADLQAFKLYVADVGLLRVMSRLSPKAFMDGDRLFTEFRGALTENFVLQELVSSGDAFLPFYWKSKAEAEVEFVIQVENAVVPVEVKSGTAVRSRSLQVYRERYRPGTAVRASLLNLKRDADLINVPLFLSSRIPDFVRGA